jgi:hypothetical protein
MHGSTRHFLEPSNSTSFTVISVEKVIEAQKNDLPTLLGEAAKV